MSTGSRSPCWRVRWREPAPRCTATPVQTGSPLARRPLRARWMPRCRDGSPQAQEAAGKALHAQGRTPAARPWCRELASLILSGRIRFTEIGCISGQAGLAAKGRGSGSAGCAGAVPDSGRPPRGRLLQLTVHAPPGAVLCRPHRGPAPGSLQRGPGDPPVGGEMPRARPLPAR